MTDVRTCQPEDHVGFDSLPYQLVEKSAQNGYVFNVLCVGETGIGKSTLMNSLFNTTFDSDSTPHNLASIGIKSDTYDLRENNVHMNLTIVNTIGFGDQVNKENSFQPILKFVDEKFEEYLHEELKTKRCMNIYQDKRLHVCLYFICPTGHGLKDIDVLCMKRLDNKVNIIPIIAKADSICKADLKILKKRIMGELSSHGIKIYQFPTDDESVSEINSSMVEHLPFAIVCSNDFVRVGNNVVRGRQYPWGTVQVENEAHCDFVKLREMLIRTNMEDLREKTHSIHYELYRKRRLEQMGFSDFDNENNPIHFQQSYEVSLSILRQEFLQDEDDLKRSFFQRVEEKEAEFKETENTLKSRFEEMKGEHLEAVKQLEKELDDVENEITEFQKMKFQFMTRKTSGTNRTLSMGTIRRKKST